MNLSDEMKSGLVFSGVLHVAVAVIAAVGIPSLMREQAAPSEAITVELFTVDDETRMPEPETRQPEPKEEKVAAAEPEPAPKFTPQEMPPDDAVPLPDAKPKKVAEVEPQPKPRIIPNVAPRTKPKPPSRLNTSQLAALIDKSIEEPAPKVDVDETDKKVEEAVQQAQRNRLTDMQATATINAIIQRKMLQCWSVPAGAKDAADQVVSIRLWLAPDGSLLRHEILDRDRMNEPGQEFFRAAAESAARAVQRCAPYSELPREKYDLWNELTFRFNPGDMIRG